MKFRILVLSSLGLILTACNMTLAEDITPPPNYVPPTPVPTLVLYPLQAPNLAKGETIYIEKCAPCHGDSGLGDSQRLGFSNLERRELRVGLNRQQKHGGDQRNREHDQECRDQRHTARSRGVAGSQGGFRPRIVAHRPTTRGTSRARPCPVASSSNSPER